MTTPPADPDPPPGTSRSLSRRAIDLIVPRTNPGGAAIGLITIGALLAAESANDESYVEVLGSVVVALLLYWAGHTYADIIGHRLELGERLTLTRIRQAVIHESTIVWGASIPLIPLLIAWATGASTSTAVLAAIWTCVGCLLTFELAAGLQAKLKPLELLIEMSAGAAISVAILALRVILH